MSGRPAKPVVTTSCIADSYSSEYERIIEFDSLAGGGLISFTVRDGQLHVHVYRQDPTVVVTAATDTLFGQEARTA